MAEPSEVSQTTLTAPSFPPVRLTVVLAMMEGKKKGRQTAYRQFVEMGLAETDDEFHELLRESRLSVGGDGFRRWVAELHHRLVERSAKSEDVAFRRTVNRMNPDDVIKIVCKLTGGGRWKAALSGRVQKGTEGMSK